MFIETELEINASIQYPEITEENIGIYTIETTHNFMKWTKKWPKML
jgi:hypothetical protein